jgi:hypothetical protein
MTPIKWLPGARPLLLAGVAVLVGALALLAPASWQGDSLPGGRGYPSEQLRLAAHEQNLRDSALRLRRKQRVSDEVLAGRLTLLEAAALFRALDHGPPPFHWDHFRISRSGNSDDERHCKELIDWVDWTQRKTDPARAEALRKDLRAELSEHLGRGPLRLPHISELPAFIDSD